MKMRRIFSLLLSLCMVCSILSISASAASMSGSDVIPSVEIIPADQLSITPPAVTRGVTRPTQVWDLSQDDYSSTFYFNTSIYSNNLYSNHGGEFWVYVNSWIAEDDPDGFTDGYTMDVNLCRKGFLGDNIYEVTETIDIGSAFYVHFYNLDPDTDYYLIFDQPYSHRAWHVDGTFTVTSTDPT